MNHKGPTRIDFVCGGSLVLRNLQRDVVAQKEVSWGGSEISENSSSIVVPLMRRMIVRELEFSRLFSLITFLRAVLVSLGASEARD